LMIWYVWKLAFHREPPTPISEALDQRVDILRKTMLYDGRHPALGLNPPNEKWDNLKSDLEATFYSHATATNTDALEGKCWEILAPLILPNLREKFQNIRQVIESPYSCWRYSFLSKHGLKPELINCIDIHFYNAFSPESPFKPPQLHQVTQDLLRVLEDAKKAHTTAKKVVCGSWLNQLPPFLKFFPSTWTESFEAWEFSSGTAGHWGQYMDRRGAFHRHNASKFRDLGKHPYTFGICHCDIDNAIHYVREQLHQEVVYAD